MALNVKHGIWCPQLTDVRLHDMYDESKCPLISCRMGLEPLSSDRSEHDNIFKIALGGVITCDINISLIFNSARLRWFRLTGRLSKPTMTPSSNVFFASLGE